MWQGARIGNMENETEQKNALGNVLLFFVPVPE